MAEFIWEGADKIFAPLPPTPWAVQGLQLCPGRPLMLAGSGHSGKTLASQSMALSCAAHTQVWGKFWAARPLKIRHIDHEQGSHATKKRYQRLAFGLRLTQEHIDDRMEVAIFPPVYLNQPNAYDAYSKAAEKIDVIILDALRGATPGTDENDTKIGSCLDTLSRVSNATGCAFWVLHHVGKPKEGGSSDLRAAPRGSSAIFDACGSVFLMTSQENRKDPAVVRHIKAAAEADGGLIDDFTLGITDVASDESPYAGLKISYLPQAFDDENSADPLEQCTASILRAVRRHPNIPRVLLKELAKGKAALIEIAINELVREGKLIRRASGDTEIFVTGGKHGH